MSSPLRILILGGSRRDGGSLGDAVVQAASLGFIPNAHVNCIVTGSTDAGIRHRAIERGMDPEYIAVLPESLYRGEILERALYEICDRYGINCVVQCGWLRLTPRRIVERYSEHPNVILNAHGGALNPRTMAGNRRLDFGGPGMIGRAPLAATLHYARKTDALWHARATIHLVTERLDAGGIVREWIVPMANNDTIESLGPRMKNALIGALIASLGDFASHGYLGVIEPETIVSESRHIPALIEAREFGVAEYPNG